MNVFLIISFVLTIIILLLPFALKRTTSVGNMANAVVTLGILGTFSGIVLGLLGFDVNDISGSVPSLLEGLRFAFLTSIGGIAASVLIKLWPGFYGIKTPKLDANKQENIASHMLEVLERIDKGISGDGETTLVTQIQKLRTTTSDSMADLNKSFNEFADKIVADSTQSLIDALTQVMRNFNTQINEQFGDNFKHLNESVGKMLDWQKEYYERIEVLTSQFQVSVDAMLNSEQVLTSLVKKAAIYQETSEKLDSLIVNLNTNTDAFANLAENAKNAFPLIEDNLNSITSKLKENIDAIIDENKTVTDRLNDAIKTIIDNNEQASESMSESIADLIEENKRVSEMLHNAVDDQIKSIETAYKDLEEEQKDLNGHLRSNMETMVNDTTEALKSRTEAIDEALQEELNKALSSLGRQLVSLSEKFASDYKPLTEKLREVLEISKNLDNGNS